MPDNWYSDLMANEPSSENPFGREILAERRDSELQVWLKCGGSLTDYLKHKANTSLGKEAE